MTMEENIKKLEKELRFLTDESRKEEIEKNKQLLSNSNIKELARNIYISRGLDITKLKGSFTNNLMEELNNFFNSFRNKDKETKRKMVIDIVYLVLLIILLKIPFDLVRDIGYEYIEMLSTNNLFYTLWNLAFLLIYTITIICAFVVLVRNFNNKYNK